jgi:hypothetical protein
LLTRWNEIGVLKENYRTKKAYVDAWRDSFEVQNWRFEGLSFDDGVFGFE